MGVAEGVPGNCHVAVVVTATNGVPIHGYSIVFRFAVAPQILVTSDYGENLTRAAGMRS
jgi:hypothetical protein